MYGVGIIYIHYFRKTTFRKSAHSIDSTLYSILGCRELVLDTEYLSVADLTLWLLIMTGGWADTKIE
jgi:hypothetical protein